VRTVPDVQKAVRWNSPFYGIEGQGWFLNFHCFTKYVKVAFFRGTSLRPVPPGESKHADVRYLDIHEDDQLDEKQLATWIERFFRLWCRNQWKRERIAPSFHLDDRNVDPRSWCRFPILSGSFERELAELRSYVAAGSADRP
jgi:hypothetical protein